MKKLSYRDSFSKIGNLINTQLQSPLSANPLPFILINTQLQLGGSLPGFRLPLPFRRGEGRGEGSVCSLPFAFGSLPVAPAKCSPHSLPSRLLLAAALIILVPVVAGASDPVTNRFTFSGRFSLNIKAKFQDVGRVLPAPPRTTPDGANYNYDDGYVLTDSSGNFGGQTWNWGYDNSASQISGNTILLSRSAASGRSASASADSDPGLGAELAYDRLFIVRDKFRFGLEAAANFLDLSMQKSSTFSRNVTRTTDAYPFTPGTTPPLANPAQPYQGSFGGAGFVIGDTPVSSTPSIIPGTIVTAHRRLDSNLWGFRVGPYVEFPLSETFSLWASGGFAFGILDNSLGWRESTLAGLTSGSGRDASLLLGGYAGVNVSWQFSDQWSAVAGAQYQNLGTYVHTFGSQRVELDLSQSIFLTVGLGYSF